MGRRLEGGELPLDQLYAAALGECEWDVPFGRIGELLRSDTVGFTVRHRQRPREVLDGYLTFHDETRAEAFRSHWAAREPVVDIILAQPDGKAFTLEQLGLADWMSTTEFYNDFMVPHGEHHSIYATHYLDRELLVGVAAHRHSDHGAFEEDERAWVQRLLPHVARAAQAASLRSDRGLLQAANNQLGRQRCGMFALGRHAELCFANGHGIKLLERADLIDCAGHRIRFTHQADQHAFRRACQAAVSETECVFLSASGRFVLRVEAVPWSWARRAVHVLFVTELGRAPRGAMKWLRNSFGLTRAEAEVAIALVETTSLEHLASQRAVSIGTVRNQVKVVMAKVGVRKQSELCALLASVPDE